MIVVLSQNTLSGPTIRDFEESFVADLLMKEHLEVSIIDALDTLLADDTGHLCLQGIKGDMFIAHWGDSEAAKAELGRLEIIGTFAAVEKETIRLLSTQTPALDELPILAPGVYDPHRRKLYLLNLDQFDSSFQATTRVAKMISNPGAPTADALSPAIDTASKHSDTDTVRPMPKRVGETESSSSDPLDDLIGDLDGLDL